MGMVGMVVVAVLGTMAAEKGKEEEKEEEKEEMVSFSTSVFFF